MTSKIDPGLTGAAFDLANAGYRPMPDLEEKPEKEAIESSSASLRQAAQKISMPPDPVVVREYRDQGGKPVSSSEAITLDRAARDYAAVGAAEKLDGETTNSPADPRASELDGAGSAENATA